MSFSFSSADLEAVSRSIQVLVSSLDHPEPDAWCSEVNRALRQLLRADSAVFLLPREGGPMLYSDEYDDAELAKSLEWSPPLLPDGRSVLEREVELGVATLADLYGDRIGEYVGSEYYNEYAAPNGAHGSLVAALVPAASPRGTLAGIQFWHERLDGFGDREVTLLRTLFPALQSGIETRIRWGSARADLLQSLDGLAHPSLVCDHGGGVLHQTTAMTAALEADAEPSRLRGELLAMAREVFRCARATPDECGRGPGELARDVSTSSARYRISGCVYRGPGAPTPRQACALVGLQRLTPARRSEQDLQSLFSLTPAEARVAILLADGRPNAEIAKMLFMSPHTARRHTERILQKLNVRSRAEAAARILG